MRCSWKAIGPNRSSPCQEQAEDIAEIVSRIGDQSQRVRKKPAHDFNDDEPGVERDANRDCGADGGWGMRMGVAVMMGVCVGVSVAVKTTRLTELVLDEALPPV